MNPPRVFEVLREITIKVFGFLTAQNNALAMNMDWPRYVRKLLSFASCVEKPEFPRGDVLMSVPPGLGAHTRSCEHQARTCVHKIERTIFNYQ